MKSLMADPVTLAYHELRAPLGLVATAARSAAADCEDESLRKRCEMIVRAAERMLRTAQSVMSLAEGSQPAESQRITLSEVVERLADDARALGFPVAAATCAFSGQVNVPLAQLETLLQSLLNNAFDHGSVDDGALIQIHTRREDNCAVVEVANAVGASRQHQGIGAGSYLTARLAHQFGGMIEGIQDGDIYRACLLIPIFSDSDDE